jgi:hypothetical protein
MASEDISRVSVHPDTKETNWKARYSDFRHALQKKIWTARRVSPLWPFIRNNPEYLIFCKEHEPSTNNQCGPDCECWWWCDDNFDMYNDLFVCLKALLCLHNQKQGLFDIRQLGLSRPIFLSIGPLFDFVSRHEQIFTIEGYKDIHRMIRHYVKGSEHAFFDLIFNAVNSSSTVSLLPKCLIPQTVWYYVVDQKITRKNILVNLRHVIAQSFNPSNPNDNAILEIHDEKTSNKMHDIFLDDPKLKGKTASEARHYLSSMLGDWRLLFLGTFEREWMLKVRRLLVPDAGESFEKLLPSLPEAKKVMECYFFEDTNTKKILASLILLEQEKRKKDAQNTFLRGCV